MLKSKLSEVEEPGSNQGAAIYSLLDAGQFTTWREYPSHGGVIQTEGECSMHVLFEHNAAILRKMTQ